MEIEILSRSKHLMAVVVEFLIFNCTIFAFSCVLVFNLLSKKLVKLMDANWYTQWLRVSHTIDVFFFLHCGCVYFLQILICFLFFPLLANSSKSCPKERIAFWIRLFFHYYLANSSHFEWLIWNIFCGSYFFLSYYIFWS